jgi:hypothetical protein
LWLTDSDKQIYVIEQHAHPVTAGPALVFAALIPDMDHFMGHHGGRVLPLYRNVEATIPNIAPGLLNLLADELAISVAPLDLLAYIAAVVAHSGFTRYFARDLRSSPGIRVPLTRQPQLWGDAVRVGRKVLWLHTYGERCVDVDAGRHPGPPKIQAGRPIVTVTIPDSESGMPDRISYDEKWRALLVGEGEISPVAPEVWSFQVSGMLVVKHWFEYRKKRPRGAGKSPLDAIVAKTWTSAMTSELLELLNVIRICVELEPHQDELLARIIDGPLITTDALTTAGVLPVPDYARRAPTSHREIGLFS